MQKLIIFTDITYNIYTFVTLFFSGNRTGYWSVWRNVLVEEWIYNNFCGKTTLNSYLWM